jgi:hypothetical protein
MTRVDGSVAGRIPNEAPVISLDDLMMEKFCCASRSPDAFASAHLPVAVARSLKTRMSINVDLVERLLEFQVRAFYVPMAVGMTETEPIRSSRRKGNKQILIFSLTPPTRSNRASELQRRIKIGPAARANTS